MSSNATTELVDEKPHISQPATDVPAFSLESILGDNHDAVEHPGTNGVSATGWDEETPENAVAEGFCIECEGGQCQFLVSRHLTLLTPLRPACSGRVRDMFRCIL